MGILREQAEAEAQHTIEMLQNKVDNLQKIADAECERCFEMAKMVTTEKSQYEGLISKEKAEAHDTLEMVQIATTEELRVEGLISRAKAEAQKEAKGDAQQLLSRINTQKLEHESAMVNKNGEIADLQETCQRMEQVRRDQNAQMNTVKLDRESAMVKKDAAIAELQEKCHKREETMEKLEKLCTKARADLLHLRGQKKLLEGMLERLMQHIKDLKQSREAIDVESMDIIEQVSPKKGHSLTDESGRGVGVQYADESLSIEGVMMNGFDGICGAGVPTIDVPELANPVKDFGSELDALLTGIEAQLEVGKCGAATKSESRFNLSTKSW